MLLLIWLLQIFFLRNYYDKMKITSTETLVATIQKSYDTDGDEIFSNKLQNIADNDDIYVRIVYKNNTIFSSKKQSELYNKEFEESEKILTNYPDEDSVSFILEGVSTKRETWVYAGYLDASHDTILYVFAPLYPVASTISILQNQLVYILFISLAFAFLLSIYISYRITTPIKDLTNLAVKFSKGDFSVNFRNDYFYSEINDLSIVLNKATDEVEKSIALQKNLMANVSHDLRTPLTMVKSYAEMIRDLSGNNPEKRNTHLQIIIDESDRLNSLVDDILTLSSIQAGTFDLSISNFSIQELITSIIQPYKIIEKQDGYNIIFNCKQDVQVIGDQSKIRQVVSNLLTNAIKYCGDDKKIFINVKKWGQRVHCEIIDHGQGIKSNELPHVWERYYQSSTHHVRNTQGSGIGLSIVKEILLAHNARFGVESKVGRGTTFWFELEVTPNELLSIENKSISHP